jgi:uroporphyrinogen-III decarboxylase
VGEPLKTAGWGFADDSIALISTQTYLEAILPHHRRLMETFSEGGPNSIHLCGDATRHFPSLKRELNVMSFDTGFPVDFALLRESVGEEVEILGGPSTPFLCQATPDEVRQETRRILESGIMLGGRFILREGNNLPPDVGVEKVQAMYDTVRECGLYGVEP